jgi:hypothetical protein
VRPAAEPLEDRLVPTIIFHPHFGAETVSDGHGDVLNDVPIYLIFNGGFWNTTTMKQVDQALTAVLDSPYLSGTGQYRWNLPGHATVAKEVVDPNPLSDGFGFLDLGLLDPPPFHVPPGTLSGNVKNLLDNGLVPEPEATANQPLYLVVTAPGIGSSATKVAPLPVGGGDSDDGYHAWFPDIHWGWNFVPFPPFIVPVPDQVDDIMTAWVGTTANGDGSLDMDEFTQALSHEVVESILDPGGGLPNIPLLPHAGFTASGGLEGGIGFDELADGEPNQPNRHAYAYRLPVAGSNGVSVQAYWSRADNAFIVPDGNSEDFDLYPNYLGNDFLGDYALTIRGGQIPGGGGDTVTIGTAPNGGVTVNLNGQIATFDPRVIEGGIDVELGAGTNNVNIEQTPDDVTIHETTGQDTINISPGAHQFQAVGSGVSISAGSAHNTLNVYDQATDIPDFLDTYTVTSTSVETSLAAGITYDRVNALNLDGGQGVNDFQVQSMSAGSALQLTVSPQSSDSLEISPTAEDLSGLPNVTVTGNGTATALTLFDQRDQGQEAYTIDPTTISRANSSGVVSGLYTFSGLTSLALDGGAGPDTSFDVEGLGASTTLAIGTGANTVAVTPSSGDLSNLAYDLTVYGNGTSTAMTVNDQDDQGARSYVIDAGTIRRSQAGAIHYDGLSTLELDGGAGSDTVAIESTSTTGSTTVRAGGGTTAISVSPTARNLDGVGSLVIYGGGAAALTVDDQNNPDAPYLFDSTSYTFSDSATLIRTASYPGIHLPFGGYIPRTRTATINYYQVQSLTLNTGNYRNVDSVQALAVPTTIHAGASGDTITVGPSLDAIGAVHPGPQSGNHFTYFTTGQLTVDAHGGTLTLDDRGTQDDSSPPILTRTHTSILFTIGNAAVTRTALVHEVYAPRVPPGFHLPQPPPTITDSTYNITIDYQNVSNLVVDGSSLATDYDVTSTAAATPVTINTGGGNDTVNVGAGVLDNLPGAVTVSGQGGTVALDVNDQSATTNKLYTLTAANFTRPSFGGLTYSGIGTLTINAETGLNQASPQIIDVQGTASGTTTTLNAMTGAHDIGVGAVGNSTNSLSALRGPLTIDGQGYTDILSLYDTTSNAGRTYTFGAGTTTGTDTISATADANGLAPALITYGSALAEVALFGTNYNDTCDMASLPHGTPMVLNMMNGQNTAQSSLPGNSTWSIYPPAGGAATVTLDNQVTFGQPWNLLGGPGSDAFTFVPQYGANGGIGGFIDGGGGINALDYSQWLSRDGETGVSVQLADPPASGTASGVGLGSGGVPTPAVRDIQNLIGSRYNDTLIGDDQNNVFQSPGGRKVMIGKGGNDTFRLWGPQDPGTIIDGGPGNSTLWAADFPNTWNITGLGSGTLLGTVPGYVSGCSFSHIANLLGGGNSDVFHFAPGAGVTGWINGNLGLNTLDYSAYTTPVTVNLSAYGTWGRAMNAPEGVMFIQVVLGSRTAPNFLTGSDVAPCILVGGSSADVLTAGTARSILIGGGGADALTWGTADDILIGGTTSYDSNLAALDAILGEWGSTDDFQTRVNKLRAGVGPGGAYRLVWGTTVQDDGAADTFRGSSPAGSDWFFGALGPGGVPDLFPNGRPAGSKVDNQP